MAFDAGVIQGQLRIDGKQFNIFAQKVNTAQKAMAGQAGRTGGAFKGMWKQMAVGLGVAGGVALAMRAINTQFKDMIKKGREFEREWANVTTMLTIGERETKKMRDELLRMSPILGDTTTLAKGMYQVLSASIEPAKAIKFLGEAAKSAKAGVTDAKTAVDALTTVINAYGKEAEDVTDVSDIMFATVKRGKLTYEELANSLGTCVPIAATIGIEFDEVAAAISTMTRQGVVASKATMQLRQVMSSILRPSEQAIELAEELGLEFSATALRTKGLSGFMADLREKTGGNAEMMATLVPNVRALLSVMILAGSGAEGFATDLEWTANASGLSEIAFQKQMKSMDFWIETAKTSIDKFKISFYEGLVTPFREGIETSADLEGNIKDLIDVFNELGKAIGTVTKTGLGKFIGEAKDNIATVKFLTYAFEGITLAIKRGQIPTLKNAAIAWAENKREADAYAKTIEHLEKWLILGTEKTEGATQATYDFGDALKEANEALNRIEATQFKKELDDFYEGLKNLEEPAEEFTDEAGSAESAWSSVLDQLGMQIYGINIFFENMTGAAENAAETIGEKFKLALLGIQEELIPFMEAFSTILGQIDAIAEQTYQNEMIRINNEYQAKQEILNAELEAKMLALDKEYAAKEKKIKNEIKDEEERKEALEGLEEERLEAVRELEEDAAESQKELEEEMETMRKEAQLERAKANKAIAMAAAVMNVAQAVTKTLTSVPWPFNLPLAAAVAALGAIHIGKISAQPLPSLEEGGVIKKRTIIEVAEAGPEAVIPLDKFPDIMADYEKRRTGRRAEPSVHLEPATIRVNIDGKQSAIAILKYTYELTKNGMVKIHTTGLTEK